MLVAAAVAVSVSVSVSVSVCVGGVVCLYASAWNVCAADYCISGGSAYSSGDTANYNEHVRAACLLTHTTHRRVALWCRRRVTLSKHHSGVPT
jgi:hypothetical protein